MSKRSRDPETLKLESYNKDRQYDLEMILREIKALQLEVISKRLKVGEIPTQEKLSPFGYSSFDGHNLRQKYYSEK